MLDLLGRGVDLLLALLGAPPQAQHQMEGGFLLDVVIGQGATVFELFAGEDEALLIGWDAFFVYMGHTHTFELKFRSGGLKGGKRTLDLGFDIVDGVGGFDLEGDGFAREGLDENLHLGLGGGSGLDQYSSAFLCVRCGFDGLSFLLTSTGICRPQPSADVAIPHSQMKGGRGW